MTDHEPEPTTSYAGSEYSNPSGFDYLLYSLQNLFSRSVEPGLAAEKGLPGTTPGIDISHWQGERSEEWWKTAFEEGIQFAFIKATGGTQNPFFVDPRYEQNKERARAAGIKVGAYCFASLKVPGDELAEHFIEIAGDLDIGGALDLEYQPNGVSDTLLNRRTEQFLATLNAFYGYSWMYSAAWFLDERPALDPDIAYYRWVAHWTNNTTPYLPRIWRDREYDCWQFSSRGTVAGKFPIDLNRMQTVLFEKLIGDDGNGDLVELKVKPGTVTDLQRAIDDSTSGGGLVSLKVKQETVDDLERAIDDIKE